MSLDRFLRLGETVILGTHSFDPEEIKVFARKFDPQPFHTDEEAARHSLLGGLCASGWHTCAMWMKYNLIAQEEELRQPWPGPEPKPEFGPSPGFSDLKWPKPVYAGDEITFTRCATGYRQLSSRPGWKILTLQSGARNQDGDAVLSMTNAVLLKA